MVSHARPVAPRGLLHSAADDALKALSSQVDGVSARAGGSLRRAVDPAWWSAELDPAARAFDDGWARCRGAALRRAAEASPLRHPRTDVTHLTHRPSQPLRPILAAAIADTLPARRPGRAPRLHGSFASGLVLTGLAGGRQLLPAAGAGLLLVLCGTVLLAAAASAVRVRAARSARARATTLCVRAAVLTAAERELARRVRETERALGLRVTGRPAPPRRSRAGGASVRGGRIPARARAGWTG